MAWPLSQKFRRGNFYLASFFLISFFSYLEHHVSLCFTSIFLFSFDKCVRALQTHLCGCRAAVVVPAAIMAVVEHRGFWVCRPDAATRGSAVSGYRPA